MNRYIKKIILIISTTLACIILTSCRDSIEVDQIGISLVTGIDMEDGKIVITNEIVKPRSLRAADPTSIDEMVTYVQTSGETINEALDNAKFEFNGEIILSHNMLYILGEDFCKEGIAPVLDFFQRDDKQRELSYLAVAKDAKAYEVMGISDGVIAPGNYLLRLMEDDKSNSKSRSLELFRFFKYGYEKNNELVFGVVKKVEKEVINKEERQKNKKKELLNIEGGAVFNKDRLIGYYSGEEMIGFNYIINNIESQLITINTPYPSKKNKKEKTVIEIMESKTERDIEIIDGKINLNFKVRGKGVIAGQIGDTDITDYEVFKEIERLSAKEVEKYITNTMEKSQKEFKQDNFSMGVLLRRKYPDVWEAVSDNWAEVFSDMDYTFDIEISVLRTGLVNKPGKKEGDN